MTEFQVVRTDSKTFDRLKDCIRSNRWLVERSFGKDNLTLAYGVTDSENKVFIAQIYFLSEAFKRCDEGDEYEYIVLTENDFFTFKYYKWHPDKLAMQGYEDCRQIIEDFCEFRFRNRKAYFALENKLENEFKMSENKELYKYNKELVKRYFG